MGLLWWSLRLHTPNTGGPGLIPGQGTKILHAASWEQKKLVDKKKKKKTHRHRKHKWETTLPVIDSHKINIVSKWEKKVRTHQISHLNREEEKYYIFFTFIQQKEYLNQYNWHKTTYIWYTIWWFKFTIVSRIVE